MVYRIFRPLIRICGLLICVAAIAKGSVDNHVLSDESGGDDWPAYGRTFSEQRYSPLKQINDGNVTRLGLAWSIESPEPINASAAPIEADGVIYYASGFSVLNAVDARSGRRIWRFDPEVTKFAGKKLRAGWLVRGLALWKDKVLVGTVDGRLIAVDSKTGKLVWSAMTVDPRDARYITGAPRVFNGKVIIGHGGGDYGATRGYVTAYDAETGRQLWRFYTVPGDPAKGFENKAMELAAKTWTGEWWKFGGGGTVWNAITYDPQFNRIYIGTGNGSPWNRKIRSPGGGDNLFLCSIVALDADTGEYIWHYQTNPGESWDFDAAMDMVLATLTIDGKPRNVLLHAPKNGFFYVIDRENGKLISAERIVKVTWAERIDLATGRPVEAPNIRYESGATAFWPGSAGAHNIQPMAYSPATGLVYIPVRELPGRFSDEGIDPATWKPLLDMSPSQGLNRSNEDPPANAGTSALLAWDPTTQREAWRIKTPGIVNGGIAVTAGGLVFQGLADGRFVADAATDGRELWSFQMGTGTLSAPITFMFRGEQYVCVIASWAGAIGAIGSLGAQFGWVGRDHPHRLLTFVLDGREKIPKSPPPNRPVPVDDSQFEVDAAQAAAGKVLFGSYCANCHGAGAVAAGYAPDLRASPVVLSGSAFARVISEGVLESRGMPRFSEFTDAQIGYLRHYIRAQARQDMKVSKELYKQP